MRLHRFYVPQPIEEKSAIVLQDSDFYHQLKNVFRFTAGGQVILFDNSGFEYHCMISDLSRGEIALSIISKKEGMNISKREVHLFVSLAKKDTFEWVLEKGTELGVTRFIPIVSDRSEKKNINMERAKKIVIEASEQSGRVIIPTISEVTKFDNSLDAEFHSFAFDPKGDVFTIEHTHTYSPIGIFIGPEGGWTERELTMFKQNNIGVYSFGSQILKAETASIAVASLLLLQ